MAFRGWSVEALEFFEGLEADNSKAYWERNKSIYETSVRAPMEELLAELEPEFGPGKLFRPYRDVRFSADKSPYKTSIAATIGDAGYVHLTAEAFGVGSGMYMMAPDQLERYRRAVDGSRTGAALERIIARIEGAGIETTGHDSLKTAPKGYPKDHPRIGLLRNKGLIAWKEWPSGAWLGTRRAKDRVADVLRAATPLNDWLRRNVGASTMERER